MSRTTITVDTEAPAAPQGVAAPTAPATVPVSGHSARQGEWLFVRLDAEAQTKGSYDPVGAEGAPLSYYERRAHVLTGDVSVRRSDDGDVVEMHVGPGGAEVRHDEHRWLEFPPGSRWRVMRQRVADPLSLVERQALD